MKNIEQIYDFNILKIFFFKNDIVKKNQIVVVIFIQRMLYR